MEDLKDKLINELIEKGWNIEYVGGGYGQNLINDILESETIKSEDGWSEFALKRIKKQ